MQMLFLKKVPIVGIISIFAVCYLTGFSVDKTNKRINTEL